MRAGEWRRATGETDGEFTHQVPARVRGAGLFGVVGRRVGGPTAPRTHERQQLWETRVVEHHPVRAAHVVVNAGVVLERRRVMFGPLRGAGFAPRERGALACVPRDDDAARLGSVEPNVRATRGRPVLRQRALRRDDGLRDGAVGGPAIQHQLKRATAHGDEHRAIGSCHGVERAHLPAQHRALDVERLGDPRPVDTALRDGHHAIWRLGKDDDDAVGQRRDSQHGVGHQLRQVVPNRREQTEPDLRPDLVVALVVEARDAVGDAQVLGEREGQLPVCEARARRHGPRLGLWLGLREEFTGAGQQRDEEGGETVQAGWAGHGRLTARWRMTSPSPALD